MAARNRMARYAARMANTRAPHLAIVGAALVAGAFEAAHGLAWQGRLAVWPIAFEIAGIAVELELLTAVFEHGLARRRSVVSSFALSSVIAVGAGIATSFAESLLQRILGVPVFGGAGAPSAAIIAQLGAFDGVVGLGLWAVAVAIPQTLREANARTLEAARFRSAAELARLRANLQPHFLFNTLSTIAGLVSEDPHAARELIGALGELLRDSLEYGADTQTIEDEVAWLRRYAAILEIRHRGNLTFRWNIAAMARDVRIPRLLLQPLLENAVQHGALRRREGGEVSISAAVDGIRLTCIVEDNGPGPATREPRDGAHGLELVARRLELEYIGAAAFRLEANGGLTRAIVELPIEAP
jgi:hypothetical protein